MPTPVGAGCEDEGVDLVSETLPYVLPLALAVVAALVSPALITPRKLRQDLAIDAELVDRLPPAERVDLGADVKRRARHLIAMTRYPPLTLYDLLAVLGHTAIVVTVIVGQVMPMSRDEDVFVNPFVLGAPAFFAASCWGAFYVPWATRAKARLEHIQKHLGEKEATETARAVRVAYFAALLAGPGAIVGMQATVAVTVHRVDGQDYWLSGNAVLGGVLALLALYALARNVKLFDKLLDLSERHKEVRALLAHREKRTREKQEPTVGDPTSGG